jgi:hypothetical protein
MMLTSELTTYLREAMFREPLAQVHGNLSWDSNLSGIILRGQLINTKTVMRRDCLLNLLDCNSGWSIVFCNIANRILRQHLRDWKSAQGGDRNQAHKRAFQLAYIALHFAGNKEGYVIRK